MSFKSGLGLRDGITIHIPKDLEVGLRLNDSDSDLELQFEDLDLLFKDVYTSLEFSGEGYLHTDHFRKHRKDAP